MKTEPMTISADLLNWLAKGEHGLSSETIVQHLTGFPALGAHWGMSTPQDASDLRRCLLLLEQVPELAPRIGEMATVSGQWAEIVEVWELMRTTLEGECPTWRTPARGDGFTTRATRAILDAAIDRGRIRDGWVKTGPGSWRRGPGSERSA